MNPGIRCYIQFDQAINHAAFYAYLTGYRYRVYYDVLNRWWTVIQEVRRITRRTDG